MTDAARAAAETPVNYRSCRFGDCAIDLGYLTAEQVENVSALQQNISNQRMGRICLQEGILNHEQVGRIVARQYGLEYVDLDTIQDPDLFRKVPPELMTRFRFIPYEEAEAGLVIAMSQPRRMVQVVDRLEMLLDVPVSVVVASEERIETFLKDLETAQNMLGSISGDMKLPFASEAARAEEILSLEKVTSEESLTVKLVNSTILDAINKRASDIHIETSDAGVVIRYRIDGMLYQAAEPLDVQHQSPIVSRIKVMSELDIAEKRVPQDGRFKVKLRDRYIDFRVSILPTIFGEDAVIRILDRESLAATAKDFKLDGMGLPEMELNRLRKMIHAPYGMFLMTGPTGSGKTTTLYRALSEVQSKDSKIITIEDPVEYRLKGIVQIQVNEKKGLTFARGLRSILRHDPDKILVGEIRDAETAQIAIQSALTGHLVFTTVHANRSLEVIHRFTHMGIAVFDLMSALNCIVAQRLMRRLCVCKEPDAIDASALRRSGIDPAHCKGKTFFRPKGCENCKGTGFRGRMAVLELVTVDDELRELFIRQAPIARIKEKALAQGTVFLRQAALAQVFAGESTLAEADRVTFVEG